MILKEKKISFLDFLDFFFKFLFIVFCLYTVIATNKYYDFLIIHDNFKKFGKHVLLEMLFELWGKKAQKVDLSNILIA